MLNKIKTAVSKNWITSLIGVAIIGLQIGSCILKGGQWMPCVSENWQALMAAFALLFARDFTGDPKPLPAQTENK